MVPQASHKARKSALPTAIEYDGLTMTSKVLAGIVTDQGGCKSDGQRYLVPGGVDASVYCALGMETLTVDRVSEFQLEPEVLVLITGRAEKYVLAYEDVRGLRFSGQEGSAGFR